VGQHSGGCGSPPQGQPTRRKKSTSFWFTHLHSDHVRRPHDTRRKRRVFSQCQCFTFRQGRKANFCVSPEIVLRAPKGCASRSSRVHKTIAAPYINAGKWATRFSGSEANPSTACKVVPPAWSHPGHTGYEFRQRGQKISVLGDIIHAQRVQLQHPEV